MLTSRWPSWRTRSTLALQREIHFRVEREQGLDEVYWDLDRINEVLGNLVSNAFKFTPKGGTVELTLAPVQGGVQMRVRDTGAGIPPDQLPRIFEKFYQADNQGSARSAGTGLGLAIAKQIVDAHGGSIKCESTLGVGTTFTITLPLKVQRRSSLQRAITHDASLACSCRAHAVRVGHGCALRRSAVHARAENWTDVLSPRRPARQKAISTRRQLLASYAARIRDAGSALRRRTGAPCSSSIRRTASVSVRTGARVARRLPRRPRPHQHGPRGGTLRRTAAQLDALNRLAQRVVQGSDASNAPPTRRQDAGADAKDAATGRR